MTELNNCLKCGREPELVQAFGQWTVQCHCGVKQGHRFFNRRIAIEQWNQNVYRYVAEGAKRQEVRSQVLQEKLDAKRLFDLKNLPEDAFLSIEDALLLTGKKGYQLDMGRKAGALAYADGKYRKRELLSTDFNALIIPKTRTRSQRRFTHGLGTPEREAEEAAYRMELFALPDDTRMTIDQVEFMACTSRDCLNRNLREGKIKLTNGLYSKGDVVKWRRKYPPANTGGSAGRALKKLEFMLKKEDKK